MCKIHFHWLDYKNNHLVNAKENFGLACSTWFTLFDGTKLLISQWCCVLFIGFLCIRIRYRIHYSIFLELAAKMRWNIVPGMILLIKSEYKSYMRSTNCMKTENKRIEMAVERLWGSSSHFSLRVLLFHSTMETAEYCWYHSDLGYSWVPACITAIWKYIFLSCEEAADGKVCLFHM